MKVFKEEQRFTQLWLMVLLAMSLLVPIGLIIQEYSKQNTKMTFNQFVFGLLAILASVLLIFIFKLTTRIDEKGIHYKFFPFHWEFKLISWNEISKAQVRTYDPIGDFGGWGLKGSWSKSKGKAINVSGDIGIQLELISGKKLLIGTQKKNDAQRVLDNYKSKANSQ